MYKLLILFLVIFLYKLMTNILNYFKSKKFNRGYILWLATDGNKNFGTYKREIITLFKKANIEDATLPHVQPMGYGKIATHTISVLHNFPTRHTNQASITLCMFEEAIGTFRTRIKECFNPLYWIEQAIFMPKNLLIYMNLDIEKSAFKIVNVLLSGIWWIILSYFSLYNNQIKDFIINFLK